MSKFFLSICLFILTSSLVITSEAATDVSTKKDAKSQALLQLKVVDVHETWLDDKKAISVIFSHPLAKSESYNNFVTVTDNGVFLKESWVQSDDPNSLYLKNIKPEHKYEVFIRPGITSKTGLKLLTPKHFNVTIEKVKAKVDFLDEGKTLSVDELIESGIRLRSRSSAVTDQKVSIYRLRAEKQNDFIQKLQVNNNLDTWNVTDIVELSELILQKEFALKLSKAQRISSTIDLSKAEQGLYFISIKATTVDGNRINQLAYFNISGFDVNIDHKENSIETFTVSTKDAKLIPKAQLNLLDVDSIVKKKSDENGYASFPQNNRLQATWLWMGLDALANKKNKKSEKYIILKKIPYRKKVYKDISTNTAQLFLNKKSYKVSDKVDFSILLRDKSGKAMVDQTLYVGLLAPDNSIFAEKKIITPELGNVSGFFQLPDNIIGDDKGDITKKSTKQPKAPWKVNVYLGSQDTEPLSSVEFYVDKTDYLDAQLNIITESSIINNDNKVKFTLKGFIGENITTEDTPIVVQRDIKWLQQASGYKNFNFGIYADQGLEGSEIMQTLTLDAEGQAQFTLPKIKNTINSILSVKVQGEMQYEGIPIAVESETLTYWPAESMIGVRSLKWGSEDIESGITFEIINIDPSHTLLAAKNLELKVVKLKELSDWEYTQDKGWSRKRESEESIVEERTLSFSVGDVGKLNFSLEQGSYRLEIINPETNLHTEHLFKIGQTTFSPDITPEKLKLSLDKERYELDETAILSVESLFSGEAYIKIKLNNGEPEIKTVQLSKGLTQLEILLGKKYSEKNLEISVTGFHIDKQHYFNSHGAITLFIGQEKSELTATLDTIKKVMTLHSIDYKDVNAVAVIRRKIKKGELLLPEITALTQTIAFDERGNATINNSEGKIVSDLSYKVDLYFIDTVVNNMDVVFVSP